MFKICIDSLKWDFMSELFSANTKNNCADNKYRNKSAY